jgi:hypothetical protein
VPNKLGRIKARSTGFFAALDRGNERTRKDLAVLPIYCVSFSAASSR